MNDELLLPLTSSKVLSLKKIQNTFGFLLAYSYLCAQIIKEEDMKQLKSLFTVLLLMTAMSSKAQTKLPATAQLADDNGFQQVYLNYDRAGDEDEGTPDIMSVWIVNKQTKTATRLLVTNPDAEGMWGRMQDRNAVNVPLTQIAAAYKARFVPGESKVIVEGVPDSRNVWSYVIDLNTKKAFQLSSNSGLVGFCGEDETYIVMQSYRYNPDPDEGGRFSVLLVFTTEGRFVKEMEVK